MEVPGLVSLIVAKASPTTADCVSCRKLLEDSGTSVEFDGFWCEEEDVSIAMASEATVTMSTSSSTV